MAKPTLPTWCTDGVHVVATTAGHKTSGYQSNEIPSSAEINDWMRKVYLWCKYIDDGLWDDDLHVTGNLEVDGTTQLDGNVTASGTLDVAGAATVGGTLDVAGAATFYKHVTLDTHQNVVLQGDGHLITGPRTAVVHLIASTAQVDSGAVSKTYNTPGVVIDAGTVCRIPLFLTLDQYQTITEVQVIGNSTSGALLELEFGAGTFSSAGGLSGGGTGPVWTLSGTPFINSVPLWLKITNLGSTTTLNYALIKYQANA